MTSRRGTAIMLLVLVVSLTCALPACGKSDDAGAPQVSAAGSAPGTTSGTVPGTALGSTTTETTAPSSATSATSAAAPTSAISSGPTPTVTVTVTVPVPVPVPPTAAPTAPPTPPAPTTGTLAGYAYFAPSCNLTTHANCPPVTDHVVVRGGSLPPDGQQIATNASGYFSVDLPPGTYQWRPRWMAHYVCDSVPEIVLTAGATSTTTEYCNAQ